MKLLLTSNGLTNASLQDALVSLLGKPIAESTALVVPTGIYPFSVGPVMARRLLTGDVASPLCELGWGSLGLLELTALPSIDEAVWQEVVQAADALLVWGGDPLFLAHWLQESGLTALFPSLPDLVYVGVSAGAMAACTTIGETYTEPPSARCTPLTSEEVVFTSPDGDVPRTFVTAAGAGLVDVAVIPHFENPGHPDACGDNAARWAAMTGVPTYALDDQSALRVVDGADGPVVDVVSEGRWELFRP